MFVVGIFSAIFLDQDHLSAKTPIFTEMCGKAEMPHEPIRYSQLRPLGDSKDIQVPSSHRINIQQN